MDTSDIQQEAPEVVIEIDVNTEEGFPAEATQEFDR